MLLRDYLRAMPSEAERAAFAQACGCTLSHLRFVAWGVKRASLDLALGVHRASCGAVPAESLRPDRVAVLQAYRQCRGGAACASHL